MPPVEYKFSADFTDGLYLGEEVKLIELPPFVDEDDALAAPAEEDGDELKPGMHKGKIAFATKSASSLHSSSLRGLRNN